MVLLYQEYHDLLFMFHDHDHHFVSLLQFELQARAEFMRPLTPGSEAAVVLVPRCCS
jgi:hypothetical protein